MIFMKSMSEQQPTALLAKIKDDAGLREKLQGAADPNAAVAFAKEAGFEVSKAEWLKAQASQTLELEELSAIAAGGWLASQLLGINDHGMPVYGKPKPVPNNPSLSPSLGGATPIKDPRGGALAQGLQTLASWF